MTFEGGGGVVGSPCPPSRSAHVFNAILNIKIILNGKKICSLNYVVSRLRILVNMVLMYSITLRHGLFLIMILHVARCAYVTQRTLQNSGQFMRSLEVSATDNVEENIPEYAMLSLSRIVVANQLLFAYNWMSFQCTCKTNDLTSKQGSEIISHKFLSLHANIEIMSIACQIN